MSTGSNSSQRTAARILCCMVVMQYLPTTCNAQSTCTCNATPAPAAVTQAPITPAPVQALTAPISVDFVVLTVGIALLLILFATSFYFTVIWPKRAFLEYRRRFESLVRDELAFQDVKLLKARGNDPADPEKEAKRPSVYGGARADHRKIPTMKDIELAMLKELQMEANGGVLPQNATQTSPTSL